ncbi:thioredoxin reductase-like selenoprotein T homolog CG3887 [Anabrus simplex]|uniref:thioredoxin reductase-like selenoprotein T homolog CG3887 n=1 Tax=Anabrus simplex TaxID=316456 RepID=UPI0034DCF01B
MSSLYGLSCMLVFVLFSTLTIRDLFIASDSGSYFKEIPATKMGMSQYVGPTMKFQYCYSCGYHKAFQEYGNIIQQKYPEIIIEGENYNPPTYIILIAKIIGAVKMLLVVCIISGVNIFQCIGQPQPWWWTWCVDNRLYSCLMLFFTCNAIENQLMSTGAFEITFNDVPVWSKLETGRIPQPAELFQIIDNNLRFQGKVELKPGFAK